MIATRIQKALCFVVIAGLFFLFRHLFYIIFLTFVITYMLNSASKALTRKFPYRRFNIVLLYALSFSLGFLAISFVAPQVATETRGLVKHYLDSNMENRQEVLRALDSSVREARTRQVRPRKRTEAASSFAYHPIEKRDAEPMRVRTTVEPEIVTVIEVPDTTVSGDSESILDHEIRRYLDFGSVLLLGNESSRRLSGTEVYGRVFESIRDMIADLIPRVIAPFTALINAMPKLILQSILSIFLSFLILWDLPGIQSRISAALGRTDIAAIRETADRLKELGLTIGKAFEAQSIIAVVNTCLTAAGFWLIGLPSVLFLSCVVFICSFVPVFGVMISTLPAGLLAFKIGGASKVLLLVGIIIVVHGVEAYVLDPLVYGYHLNIHPVVALVVLVVAEHFFGVWGLLLGIPVTTFILKQVFPPLRP